MIVLALWSGILFHGLFGTFGLIFPPPDNVALQIGSSTTLSCTTDTYFVGWGFTAFGASTPIAISQSGCTNMPASPISDYTFRPTLNATGAGECNVTIVSAASRFAGEYICTEHVNSADLTKSAVVIVLESGPHCSVSATNTTQVEESTPVELSCSVSYNTTEYLRPQLTWRSQQSNTTSSNTYANSSITVTHPIPVISSDTCTLRFNPPTNPPANSATNVPSYTANCATPVVHPLYCPNRPTITGPTSGNVTNGTILTCTAAVSNPQANSYEWWLFAIRGNVTERIFKSNEETVEIIEEGVYVCNATNGLPGCTNTTTTFVITNVIPLPTSLSTNHVTTTAATGTSSSRDVSATGHNHHNVTTTAPPDNPPHTVAIVLGTVIPLLIIGVIVAVGIWMWRRHNNRETTKPTQPLINGSEQQNNQQFGAPEYAGVNKSASSSNQRQDIHGKDGNQMIYGQLNIADTRRRKPIQSLIEDRPFPYATIVRA